MFISSSPPTLICPSVRGWQPSVPAPRRPVRRRGQRIVPEARRGPAREVDAGGEGESSVTITTACPRGHPEPGRTSCLCAFNIAAVLILELMPWSTRFRCIINALGSIQYFCCFRVNADASMLHLWFCAQVKHLEVSCSSMAEDICRKSAIIETYVMDSRIGSYDPRLANPPRQTQLRSFEVNSKSGRFQTSSNSICFSYLGSS